MHMRLATYNIHACIGADGRFDPGRIVRVLRQMKADVVALQEVENYPVGETGLLDYLAAETGMAAFAGPTLLRETRHYGNALLTRLPILSLKRVDLSLQRREPRGAIRCPARLERTTPAGRCDPPRAQTRRTTPAGTPLACPV